MKLGKHNFGKELLKKVSGDAIKGSGDQKQKEVMADLNKELQSATQVQETTVKADAKGKKVDWGSLLEQNVFNCNSIQSGDDKFNCQYAWFIKNGDAKVAKINGEGRVKDEE